MANPKHLKILEQGVEAWNVWRKEHKPKSIDFTFANFFCANLSGAELSGADFGCAELGVAKLSGANLKGASLFDANLSSTSLDGADLSNANLGYARLDAADLSNSDLTEVNMNGADLTMANLTGANLTAVRVVGSILLKANLIGAILNNATLGGTNLRGANLQAAQLLGVDLRSADLCGANLAETDLNAACIGGTIFGNVDLSTVKGLDTVFHYCPSTIGIDTLYKSQGQIPDQFLRDAGVPEEVIDLARSLRAGPPIQWHSCFISYSTKDDDFARRLHARMRAANMRVWFAPEDMKGGKKLHEQIIEAIQLNDRLLLVLSEHSIQSEWVMTEIRKARATELKEKRRKLFPIRLTDIATLRDWTCFDADTGKDLAVELREYFIPDFSNWKDHDAFEAAFARLQKDLQAEDQRRTP